MSEPATKRNRSSKVGKGEYRRATGASLRAMHGAKAIGRAMRMAPAAAVQMASVQRAETALAMKNAGYVDTSLSAVAFVTTSLVQQIGVVSIGSAITQRVGAKIKWKSVQIRGKVYPNADASIPTLGSFLIVYDRYPKGDAVPTAAQILASASATALLQDSNRTRFVIVRRLDFVTGPYAVSATRPSVADSIIFVDEYVKLRGLQATYIGSDAGAGSGGMGDIRTGALYVLPIGDTDGANGHCTCDFNIRVRFADVQG